MKITARTYLHSWETSVHRNSCLTSILSIVIRKSSLINELIMLPKKKINNFFENYVFCGLLFSLIVKKLDYPWIEVIKQILVIVLLLSLLLLLYATWQETHSLKEVLRQNGCATILFIIIPLILVALMLIFWYTILLTSIHRWLINPMKC